MASHTLGGTIVPATPPRPASRPAIPILVSAAVISGALFPLAPIRDAATLGRVSHVRLARGLWYVFLSPVYDSWDTITLLPPREHVTLIALTVFAYAVWRWRVTATGTRRSARRELIRVAIALGLLVAWYATGAVAPRPMVSLEVDDPDEVIVDFHSHTEASHDGRPGFSAERNREWHRAAGFDVAYISDHGTYAAIREALLRNPARAGEGTVLLPAFETRLSGQHVNVLGFSAEEVYGRLPSGALTSLAGSTPPAAMLTIPAVTEDATTRPRILAVELIDGSPLGLEFGAKRRADLLKLCVTLGAAPVAGSNNHGWGRTAPGWTILRIPGWRNLTPVALDQAILATLASRQRGRIVVIERAPPIPAGGSIHLAAAPFVWNPFRTLPISDQLAWIAWGWFAWWIVRRVRRRRT